MDKSGMAFKVDKFITEAAALIRLTRPINGAIAIVAFWLGAFVGGENLHSRTFALIAFSVAVFLILSAGNVINDILDFRIDSINRPERPLPSGKLSIKCAIWASLILMVGGVALASMAGLIPALIALFAGLSLILYSKKLKAIPLMGNILVGALTSLTFICGGLIAEGIRGAIVPAIFAFFFTVSREIFKDIQDLKGDNAAGIKTIPLVWGTQPAWRMATAFMAAGIIYSPIPYLLHNYSLPYLVIILAGVVAVLIYAQVKLGCNPGPANAGKMQRILKYDIIVGFAAIFSGKL